MGDRGDDLFVTQPYLPAFDEFVERIRPLWESRWLSNRGPLSVEFERLLAERLGVPNVWLFANGHLALELMLQAMHLPAGGEVVTTPFTHPSTVHAIVRNGLVPVFADVDPRTLCLDPALAERAITPRTCAILATHVYGFACDVRAFEDLGVRVGVPVLYDGAHAFGVEVDGEPIARFGEACMFSTHATKVFHTVEGGIVAWRDPSLLRDLPALVNFGLDGNQDAVLVGTNARMNEFEAAMGICNLEHVDECLARRRMVAERYWERLEGVEGLRVMVPAPNVTWNFAYAPVLCAWREEALSRMERAGVHARAYFSPSVDRLSCYTEHFAGIELPVAHAAAREALCLPLSSQMRVEDADRVCDALHAGGNL